MYVLLMLYKKIYKISDIVFYCFVIYDLIIVLLLDSAYFTQINHVV